MRCRPDSKNEHGFSLIELLIAMTIFAIGILSLAGMQVTSIKGNSSANTLTVATSVAQDVLVQILARQPQDTIFSANVTDQSWDFDSTTIGIQPQAIPGAGTYQATYSIVLNYNGVQNIAWVQVKVTGGNTLGGSPRQVTLVGFKRMV